MLLFWIFARHFLRHPPACINRQRLKDDALSKQLTKEINLNGFFVPTARSSFLFADDSRVTRTKQEFDRPEKVYLRTIEMKICVFRTNAENNKSTGKHFTSILFCFVFAFFAFNLVGGLLVFHARKKRRKTKHLLFHVGSVLEFHDSWTALHNELDLSLRARQSRAILLHVAKLIM